MAPIRVSGTGGCLNVGLGGFGWPGGWMCFCVIGYVSVCLGRYAMLGCNWIHVGTFVMVGYIWVYLNTSDYICDVFIELGTIGDMWAYVGMCV